MPLYVFVILLTDPRPPVHTNKHMWTFALYCLLLSFSEPGVGGRNITKIIYPISIKFSRWVRKWWMGQLFWRGLRWSPCKFTLIKAWPRFRASCWQMFLGTITIFTRTCIIYQRGIRRHDKLVTMLPVRINLMSLEAANTKSMRNPRIPLPILLTCNLPRISNHIHYHLWDEITYPFPNFNGTVVEVWKWISILIPHFIMGCNQLSITGLKLIHVMLVTGATDNIVLECFLWNLPASCR